jgi:hypothetical protein
MSRPDFRKTRFINCVSCLIVLTLLSGCAIVSVAATTVSVAGTIVSVGVSAGAAVVKGAASVGGSIVDSVSN